MYIQARFIESWLIYMRSKVIIREISCDLDKNKNHTNWWPYDKFDTGSGVIGTLPVYAF